MPSLSPRGVLDRGVRNGIWRREDREEDDVVVVDTDLFRGVGVVRRLSLRCGGRELTLAPERIEDPRDEVCAVGDTAPWVRVVLLDVLPDD